jgi:adenylate kinase family enzyme
LEYYRDRGILHRIDGVGKTDDVFGRIMAAVEAAEAAASRKRA